jgi:hypothetical protein
MNVIETIFEQIELDHINQDIEAMTDEEIAASLNATKENSHVSQ